MKAVDQIERNATCADVERLIGQLPKREGDVLALYYYEDLTLREIGQLLNLTEAHVLQMLKKTQVVLRRHVKDVTVRVF